MSCCLCIDCVYLACGICTLNESRFRDEKEWRKLMEKVFCGWLVVEILCGVGYLKELNLNFYKIWIICWCFLIWLEFQYKSHSNRTSKISYPVHILFHVNYSKTLISNFTTFFLNRKFQSNFLIQKLSVATLWLVFMSFSKRNPFFFSHFLLCMYLSFFSLKNLCLFVCEGKKLLNIHYMQFRVWKHIRMCSVRDRKR